MVKVCKWQKKNQMCSSRVGGKGNIQPVTRNQGCRVCAPRAPSLPPALGRAGGTSATASTAFMWQLTAPMIRPLPAYLCSQVTGTPPVSVWKALNIPTLIVQPLIKKENDFSLFLKSSSHLPLPARMTKEPKGPLCSS